MEFTGNMLWLTIFLPVAAAAFSIPARSTRAALKSIALGALPIAVVDVWAAAAVLRSGSLLSRGGWLHLDALSAYHLLILAMVFAASAIYAIPYFLCGTTHVLDRRSARRLAVLWHGAQATMTLVLLSNNLGIMWVGVEATTLLTTFLICLDVSPVALEASWKYLIICSVGVAFAFMGVLLVAAAVGQPSIDPHLLHWTHLRTLAGTLDGKLLRLAFVFILVGYGVKAGLAPMHSWLPDAHSQAPAPVSAVFSGFMLNMALYCIMRHIPLIAADAGAEWVSGLLVFFGLISIIIAAGFMSVQNDLKRFLAYCSIEHIGIIVLGLGLGSAGIFAALFHTFNHSVCKTLSFHSAGRLGQIFGTHDMRKIHDAIRISPLWGTALLLAILALIGVAPGAIFLSELMTMKAAVDAGRYVAMALFLLGGCVVFVGALRNVMEMIWGVADNPPPAVVRSGVLERLVAFTLLFLAAAPGLWMPDAFRRTLEAATQLIQGGGL